MKCSIVTPFTTKQTMQMIRNREGKNRVCINIELIDSFLMLNFARGKNACKRPEITSQYTELDNKKMADIKITTILVAASFRL